MCNLVAKKTYFVLLFCFAFVNSEETIENGGYSVLVSFSQNVNSTEGLDLLEKMKASLQQASSILFNTIGRQFTKVKFEIPESWDTSQMEINIDSSSVPKYAKSDFLIDATNDVIFGKFPFAHQYGGCGIPGHQITIPTAFFSDDNTFPRGTALAREWLKYRYGVFDENGYEDDPLYPLYRLFPVDGNPELRVTDCTNNPVAYDLKSDGETFSENDQPIDPSVKSKLVPDENTLGNVTSSIMYFHQDIPDLLQICGKDSDHPHNALSPNKHNAMCRSQSILEVVTKSGDFRSGIDSKLYSDIEFIYAQERRLKVVVAWENTINVGKIKGEIICNAIKRFVYELPQGSKFNGFPFSDILSVVKDYTLKKLNDLSDKNDIMTDIMSDFVRGSNGNITLAVSKALDILSSDSSNSKPEGTIIIISKSGEGISDTLLEDIDTNDVCVKILNLNEGNTFHQAEYYNLASSCGFPENIPTDKKEDMFNQLFAAMESVLPAIVEDKITKTEKTGYLSQNDSISLQVDETVEKVTFWIFTKKEGENFEMKFNKRKENLQVLKTTTDIMALSFNPGQAGSIEIAYPHQTNPIFMQVRVTLKAGKYLNGFIYVHDTTTEKSPHQMPVIIYAVIRYGAYPVQSAQVKATIVRPDESSIILEMLDDGRGDPDITENDGVYSRYFTQFSEKGFYTVNVTVEITDLTFYGVTENADYHTCCGSLLKTASSKIPVSSKNFMGIFNAKSGRPDTGYKPSRITDLRIGDVLDDKIVLKWSAPGDEGDSGTASQYEIKLFCGEVNSTDCSASKMIEVLNKSLPCSYGTEQEASIQILIKTQSLYAGIITYNHNNKTSDLSNIIQIFGPPETTVEIISKYPDASVQSGTIIGIAIVCILIIICIAIAVTFYFKRKPPYREPRDKELEEDMNINDNIKITFQETNFSIKTVPMKKVESFPVMLYTHDQIKDRRDKCKDPPLYKADLSPKPWASLDHLSSVRTRQYDRDTISLGSSSTIPAPEESYRIRN